MAKRRGGSKKKREERRKKVRENFPKIYKVSAEGTDLYI